MTILIELSNEVYLFYIIKETKNKLGNFNINLKPYTDNADKNKYAYYEANAMEGLLKEQSRNN